MPHSHVSPWQQAAPSPFNRLMTWLTRDRRVDVQASQSPGGNSTLLGTRAPAMAKLEDALSSILLEVELLSGMYSAKFMALHDAEGRPTYAVFIRLDAYIKHLMDKSKTIERRVIRQMRKRFEVDVTQVYWRYSSRVQTPWDSPPSQRGAAPNARRTIGH